MKHTTEQLIAIAHQYFPRGMEELAPDYDQTPEIQRQRVARMHASAHYDAYRTVLRRIEERFPGVAVENRSYALQSPAGSGLDRCFDGLLDLPLRRSEERRHSLQFLISFVVPYYVIYSLHGVPCGPMTPKRARSFELSSDELPFAKAIAEEIEAAFPGHERMPEDIATTVVPEVTVHPAALAMIIACLFSDDWFGRTRNAAGAWK